MLILIEKAGFEAFITNDKRMEHEQQLKSRPFATLLLSTSHWPTLEKNASKVAEALHSARPGTVIRVECGRFVPVRLRRGNDSL